MAIKATELSAVNVILSNVGMAPVSNLTSNNPMVSLAKQMLDEVSLAVQSEGWVFNTEDEYPFKVSGGYITMPSNVLSFDVEQYDTREVVLRGGKLYDKKEHDYISEDIDLNVIWLFDFLDLPETAKNYITIRAANLFAGRAVGSTESVKFSSREEGAARAALIEYETQQGDYSMLGNTLNEKNVAYTPYNALTR